MITTNILGCIFGIAFSVIATNSLKPTSLVAFIIIATWTSAPFLFALILNSTHQNKKGINVGIYLFLLIDLLCFIDIRYWHPDAQGGIAFMGLPVVGAIVIAIAINVVKTKNPFNKVIAPQKQKIAVNTIDRNSSHNHEDAPDQKTRQVISGTVVL